MYFIMQNVRIKMVKKDLNTNAIFMWNKWSFGTYMIAVVRTHIFTSV